MCILSGHAAKACAVETWGFAELCVLGVVSHFALIWVAVHFIASLGFILYYH